MEVGTIALRGAGNEGRFQSGPDEQWGEWMKIFLTGGTGFIGQVLVRSIRKRGWELQVLVRDPENTPARWIANSTVSAPGDWRLSRPPKCHTARSEIRRVSRPRSEDFQR